MRIDVALVALILRAPNSVQQVVARPGASGLRSQQLQNLKFKRRQINALALPDHFMTPLVDHQVTNLHAFIVGLELNATGPSQQGGDAILQLARTEGLREVVVGAGFVAGHLVVERVMRGQKKRRRLHAAVPDALQQFKSGQAGHRNVQDETIKPARGRGLERLHAALSLFDLESEPAKIFGQQQTHVGVVIDDQESLSGILAGYLRWLSQVSPVLNIDWGISWGSIAQFTRRGLRKA